MNQPAHNVPQRSDSGTEPQPGSPPALPDPPPEPAGGETSYLGGVVSLLATVLLLGAGWYLYATGQPGAPQFPDSSRSYGLDSEVVVYVPLEAEVTGLSLDVSYQGVIDREALGEDSPVIQSMSIFTTTRTGIAFPAVIELRGAARTDDARVDDQPAAAVDLADRLLVLVDFPAGTSPSKRLEGTMRISPVAVENYRSAFVSPHVGGQRECSGLSSLTATALAGLTFADWESAASSCSLADYEQKTYLFLRNDDRTPVRVDYTDVEPIESASLGGFSWKSDPDAGSATLRVRSSYVDVNAEAVAQRQLFLSGVFVGLGAACAPFGTRPLVAFGRFLRRAGRRTGQPATETP